jgi:hypothetical protein
MPDSACDKCQRQLMRIDFYGELLEGCIYCNVWKRKIPEEDIEALKGMRRGS